MLLDRRLTLAVEGRIKQSELPSRRGAACHNPILASIEVEVFPLIPDIVKGRHARANMEVHVRQEAVLSNVEANADRSRVALADLKVHIAHGGIKRTGICIYDARCRR